MDPSCGLQEGQRLPNWKPLFRRRDKFQVQRFAPGAGEPRMRRLGILSNRIVVAEQSRRDRLEDKSQYWYFCTMTGGYMLCTARRQDLRR